ncbi:MAG: glutamine synthetase family protein, partial [Candidatus Dormiibacterota bacterium]
MGPTDESFVQRHGLHTPAQLAGAEQVLREVEGRDLRTIRVLWVDQHGVPRGKFVSPATFRGSLTNGLDLSGAVINLDSANRVFAAAFAEGGGVGIAELTGFPDVVIVPDPATFRVLPWTDRTGWVLADAYFSNGRPHPLDGRGILRRQLAEAERLGFDYQAGLEVEFYLLARDPGRIAAHDLGQPPAPPPVSVLQHGYQFLSEVRLAALDAVLIPIRDALLELGCNLRSFEDEWGPGQVEATFAPEGGLSAADAMTLFRTTVKQVAAQHGVLATFMSWPALPDVPSSGWHLHQSLLRDGRNLFASETETLSETGRQFAAGILEHAVPMTIFTTPTITGYKRYRPYSFAPDNVNWAIENRGSMLRVQGGPGDRSTHLENRLGEPSANPYLYVAANVAAGLDGIRRGLTPPPMSGPDPYA